MNGYKKKILYWLPRILGIGFILFVSVFALDVIEPGKPIIAISIGLLIHLIPSFALLCILLLAWKYEELGGTLFILSSIIFTLLFKTPLFFSTVILITFPLLIIGTLFITYGEIKQMHV